LVAAIIGGVVLYGVGGPALELWLRGNGYYHERPIDFLVEQVRLRTLQAFSVVWFFFLGGCIGSFLNVVIYRVPRGRTLMGNSSCPYCANPIRVRHNVPVIGWLLLRGRCYDCRLPISPRYPIVEALVGTIFLVLAVVELFSGGRNLPVREPYHYMGVVWVVFNPQWDLIRLYAWHCGSLCVLLSWALIWYDRQRVPILYGALVFAIAAVAIAAAPSLEIVPWKSGRVLSLSPRLEALLRAFCGCMAGTIAGGLSWSIYRHEICDESRITLALSGALCYALAGAIVGWQGLLSIALLTPVMRIVLFAMFALRFPRIASSWPLALFCGTWLHICLWKSLTFVPAWPGPNTSLYLAPLYSAIAIYLAAQVAYMLKPEAEKPSDVVPSNGPEVS
jgi:leader peptidase (prepilin peptidase)/N-methyltransferase